MELERLLGRLCRGNLDVSQHRRFPAWPGNSGPSITPPNDGAVDGYGWISPDVDSTILSRNMLENQPLAGRFRTLPERPLVPEEDADLAPKLLIFLENCHWKIADTPNSTNRTSGKGRMTQELESYKYRYGVSYLRIRLIARQK